MTTNNLSNIGQTSSTFVKIRMAALGKAVAEVRRERFSLDEMLHKGKISQSDYQKSLMKLIIRGNKLRNEKLVLEEELD
ncbi:MAG: hypothetical protein RTU30_03170 [Candidatus Thorarchaeota archaeon]